MRIYLDLVLLLNFAVDLLLILGTNRLSGYPAGLGRAAMAAAAGGVYAAVSMLRGFQFLSGSIFRVAVLCLMSRIAFGSDWSAVRRGMLFVLLSMALGGLSMGIGGNPGSLLLALAGLTVLCLVGFRGRPVGLQFDTVELVHNGKRIKLNALRDTGNTLQDPVTGEQVLIVGPDAAWELLGLHRGQLADPVATVCTQVVTGLRLIPYRAVGRSNGMLAALRLDEVKINGVIVSPVVAFSPDVFDRAGEYQGLTGGVL